MAYHTQDEFELYVGHEMFVRLTDDDDTNEINVDIYEAARADADLEIEEHIPKDRGTHQDTEPNHYPNIRRLSRIREFTVCGVSTWRICG